ncbi:MAG: beta-propeller fold lactonase family protein [Actinomycetota bacterium]
MLWLFFVLSAGVGVTTVQAETLIVGNKVDNTLSFFDLATGEEVHRRQTVRSPHEVALSPDGRTVVVVSYIDGDYIGRILEAYDVETATPTKTITLADQSAPHGMVWLPGSERLLVTTQEPANVVAVDVARGEVTDSLSTGETDSHLIAQTKDGSRAYVTNRGSDTFTALDTAALTEIATVPSDAGTEAIDVRPDGSVIVVGNRKAETLTFYDGESLKLVDRLNMGYDPVRLAYKPDATAFVVADYTNGRVNVHDAGTRKAIATIDLSDAGIEEPAHLMFSPSGDRLFVSGQKNGVVGEYDTSNWRLRRTLAAGVGADGLALSDVVLVR